MTTLIGSTTPMARSEFSFRSSRAMLSNSSISVVPSNFVQPTVAVGLRETARCQREEIFGPFCHISPFDEEEEAVAMVNDSPYGLACALWTDDLSRAHRVAARVEAGLVWVNVWFLRDLRTPFGGVKRSGLGREGGRYSLDFYSQSSNICIKL